MSGNRSRNKGARRQREIMHRFQDACICCRNIGHAYAEGDDLEIETPLLGVRTAEVKARKDATGWRQLKAWRREADFLVLCEDRAEPLVVLDLSLLLKIMGSENV